MKKWMILALCLLLLTGCVSVPVGPSLRRQRGAAALLAAGGGDEQGEAQLPLRPADDGPGLGVGHAHGHGGLADGAIGLHPVEEHRDARPKELFLAHDPGRDDEADLIHGHSLLSTHHTA